MKPHDFDGRVEGALAVGSMIGGQWRLRLDSGLDDLGTYIDGTSP